MAVRRFPKRLSGGEKRLGWAVHHEVSQAIVGFADHAGCPVIAFEELDGIRDRRRRKQPRAEISLWEYGQLMFFIRYNA